MEFRRFKSDQLVDFQVFGERRSGTNFLSALLAETFELDETFSYGWKHGVPVMPCIQSSSLIAVIVRNPLDWVLSMHARPFASPAMTDLSFSEFIRTPWQSNYRPGVLGRVKFGLRGFPVARNTPLQYDRHPIEGRCFSNVFELRTIKMKAHIEFLERDANVAVVRYEDLAADAAGFLKAISKTFDLPIKSNATLRVGRVGPKTGSKRLTPADISSEDMCFMNDQLEQTFEMRFSYDEVFNR
ncbi:hypothetical protein [uncultured Ruegeria sp.]|uniref:hypothetical protein n=1 Tax=uncultured Ruegeria sp. TaxID=259304 RepID=UPI00261CFE30|nr:hypothetical protein [uncultured Ruegeria sp.]